MKVIKLSDGNKYIVANEIFLHKRKFYQLFDYNGTRGFFVGEKIGNNIEVVDDYSLLAEIAQKLKERFEEEND